MKASWLWLSASAANEYEIHELPNGNATLVNIKTREVFEEYWKPDRLEEQRCNIADEFEEEVKGLAAWVPSVEQTNDFWKVHARTVEDYVITACKKRSGWSGIIKLNEPSLTIQKICDCDLYTQLMPYGCKCGGK